MANYQTELSNFQQQWNLPIYDLNRVADNIQALRFADAFLMNSSADNSPTGQYLKWFSRTLSIYFETNTTPKQDGKYITSFDAQEFYNSFKALVQAKYDADAQKNETYPLQVQNVTEGQKKTIQNIIANCKRNYKKTLPTLWQENLKQGYINLDNLQNITSQAYDAINKKYYVDENEMAGNLTNIVAAREAMKQLRASRSGVWGWFWKVIFNRAQNRQEKEYLAQLNTQISQLEIKGYQVGRITTNLIEKTILGKDVSAQNETTKTQAKEAIQDLKSPAKTQAKINTIKPVAEQINQRATSDFINDVAAILHEGLPSNDKTMIYRIWVYQQSLWEVCKVINDLNENFDQAVANGSDPKKEMAKVVHGVFKETEKVFSTHMIETGLDKIEGLKTAAQIIINNFTAAAIYPNELNAAVNDYIEQNLAVYEEIVTQDKEYNAEIENYKTLLENGGDMENLREPAFNEYNDFIENSDTSPQVSQSNQINAPSINKNH